MNYRYNAVGRIGRRLYRALWPSVPSLYTSGPVEDICSIRFVPPKKFQKYFSDCIRILKEVRGEDIGDYLEFGVFNGGSLSDMYAAAKKEGVTTRFFGFDSFEGLPAESEDADDGAFKKGFYTCSFEDLQTCLRRNGVDSEEIIWIKGWYSDTLTPSLAAQYSFNPGIVLIDCDTYGSSKSTLDFLAPLITKPTIIALDDWRLYDLDLKGEGEYRSFNEFLENNSHLRAKEIGSYKRNSRSFLVTPTIIVK
jgi:O-methyltransferase